MSLMLDLVTLINRMPGSPHIQRLRIAVTRSELDEIRSELIQLRRDRGEDFNTFIYALRGIPLVLDEAPTSPAYTVEYLAHAPSL